MKLKLLTAILPMVLLTACDVHEWPDMPAKEQMTLNLHFDTDMAVWNYTWDGSQLIEKGLDEIYDNANNRGFMRYIVRAYPRENGRSVSRFHTQEFYFTKEVNSGYDLQQLIEVIPGDYDIMVWADMTPGDNDTPYYNADDFAGITYNGEYRGNTDYRDAFRGATPTFIESTYTEHAIGSIDITMQRPLAKFEFIATDLAEFIGNEINRYNSENQPEGSTPSAGQAQGDMAAPQINLNEYKIVFYYTGFSTTDYNAFTDKPVDSTTGVTFSASMEIRKENEVSLGFDYMFVNGKDTSAAVKIGIYDKRGTQLVMTRTIEVPLKRGRHTIVRGKFLTEKAPGSVNVDNSYFGDHNIIFNQRKR